MKNKEEGKHYQAWKKMSQVSMRMDININLSYMDRCIYLGLTIIPLQFLIWLNLWMIIPLELPVNLFNKSYLDWVSLSVILMMHLMVPCLGSSYVKSDTGNLLYPKVSRIGNNLNLIVEVIA